MRKRKSKTQPKHQIAKNKNNNNSMPTRSNNNNHQRRTKMAITAAVVALVLVIVAATTIPIVRRNRTTATTTAATTGTTTASSSGGFTAPAITDRTITQMGTYTLHETVPHDPTAFTQGFVTVQDPQSPETVIYEGTGMWGDSDLRIVALNGTVINRRSIADKFFGEGIAHYRNTNGDVGLLQLTWKAKVLLEYALPTTTTTKSVPLQSKEHSFSTTRNEGWGITYDPVDHVFWVSDGSAYLHLWDATDRREMKTIQVTYLLPNALAAQSLPRLNELEWDPVTRTILANVWGDDVIARIDPATGRVVTLYDCSSLYTQRAPGADVFNGIALTYDAVLSGRDVRTSIPTHQHDQVWVTGKYWPHAYRISLVDPA